MTTRRTPSPPLQGSVRQRRRPSAPGNPGDGKGDRNGEKEDLNAGRQEGEAKVLWYKEAPDAPGRGADAPGMWVTDSIAVKAVYRSVLAWDIEGGKPSWDEVELPGPSARRAGRRSTARSSSPTRTAPPTSPSATS
ncbi:hypothetical protein OIM90_11045 [Streptomyces sp. AD16]|nr:hypothetical protein OIM90_11045 [Streptomyces sp. AD16]